jgi:hypothetical protein
MRQGAQSEGGEHQRHAGLLGHDVDGGYAAEAQSPTGASAVLLRRNRRRRGYVLGGAAGADAGQAATCQMEILPGPGKLVHWGTGKSEILRADDPLEEMRKV